MEDNNPIGPPLLNALSPKRKRSRFQLSIHDCVFCAFENNPKITSKKNPLLNVAPATWSKLLTKAQEWNDLTNQGYERLVNNMQLPTAYRKIHKICKLRLLTGCPANLPSIPKSSNVGQQEPQPSTSSAGDTQGVKRRKVARVVTSVKKCVICDMNL
jgi:hypothetical protein